jgi:hypothetical protein
LEDQVERKEIESKDKLTNAPAATVPLPRGEEPNNAEEVSFILSFETRRVETELILDGLRKRTVAFRCKSF